MVKVIHHPKAVSSIVRQVRMCCRRHSVCMRCGMIEFSIGLITGITIAFMIAKVMY